MCRTVCLCGGVRGVCKWVNVSCHVSLVVLEVCPSAYVCHAVCLCCGVGGVSEWVGVSVWCWMCV